MKNEKLKLYAFNGWESIFLSCLFSPLALWDFFFNSKAFDDAFETLTEEEAEKFKYKENEEALFVIIGNTPRYRWRLSLLGLFWLLVTIFIHFYLNNLLPKNFI